MSGVNLFWYGSDDDGEQVQSEKVTTETNVADDQKKNEIETEKKVEDNTQKEEKASKPGNDLKETKEKETKKETKVSEPKKEVISTSTQSNAKSVDNDPSHWMAIVDPNTNRTYYWNQISNVTTWDCPPCLQQKVEVKSTATIVSSNITFVRCKCCGGWGTDLVRPSGMCAHCEGMKQPKQQKQQVVAQTSSVHSRAADIYMMQPRLSMYKKRPLSNIPLSRREKQKWEGSGIDPLELGGDSTGLGKRRKTNK